MLDMVLLTVEDLVKRWGVKERTVRKYIENGAITPFKKVPGVRFNTAYIEELKGIEFEKYSAYEFRILQRKFDKLQKENEELKEALREYQFINAKYINLNNIYRNTYSQ